MSSSSIQALLKILANLSVSEALILGFLLLCAVGGALTAILIGIRAILEARKERRSTRSHHGPHGVDRQG